jgi:ribosomal-protein-serine acetyltransferase
MQNLIVPIIMKKNLFSILQGERISLVQNLPTIELATKMFTTIDKNRQHLKPFLTWVDGTEKVEDSLRFLFGSVEKETGLNYGIFLKYEYIGNFGVFKISEKNRSAEIGYWISKDHAGKGYM